MITQENFECRRCADCCRYLTVKLSDDDIKAIRREGYDKDFFLDYDSHINSFVLKLEDEKCVFLNKKKGRYHCKIYKVRPKVCRSYPFVNFDKIESCKPSLLKYKFGK